MADDCFERSIGAVMAIGCGLGDITQAGGAKFIGICWIASDPEATLIAGVCFKTGAFARADLWQGNRMKVVVSLKLASVAAAALRFAVKQLHA